MLFPFFSALLGWLGVFLTGSDTSANALFGTLQVVTAQKLGQNPVLMAAANSAGGVMGKMITLTSIAVAAAATSMKREDEARLFRFTLKHSIFLASMIGLLVMFYAYVMPPAGRRKTGLLACLFRQPKLRHRHQQRLPNHRRHPVQRIQRTRREPGNARSAHNISALFHAASRAAVTLNAATVSSSCDTGGSMSPNKRTCNSTFAASISELNVEFSAV